VGAAEVDREIIPGAAFANRAILVARVGLNKLEMKTTNTDFELQLSSEPPIVSASSIVDPHGGRSWAAANSSPGASFRLMLPSNPRYINDGAGLA